LREARQVQRGTELADEPRRVPGGAAGELVALQQQHLRGAALRQVVGQRAADDAAADDDDARAVGQGLHGAALLGRVRQPTA